MKQSIHFDDAEYISTYCSYMGELYIRLKVNKYEYLTMEYENAWFYRQRINQNEMAKEELGFFRIEDLSFVGFLHEKSYTMLPLKLANQFRVVTPDWIIDIVTLTPPKLSSTKNEAELKRLEEDIKSSFERDSSTIDSSLEYQAESISNVGAVDGSISFNELETFVAADPLMKAARYPIEIKSVEIENDAFKLTYHPEKDESDYMITSEKVPEFFQIVDELIADNTFSKTHKKQEGLGPVYNVFNSTQSKGLDNGLNETYQIRIEGEDDTVDILTSHPLCIRQVY